MSVVRAQTETLAIRELDVGHTHLAHRAIRTLRTAYEDERRFAEHVDNVLRPAGFARGL